MAEGNITNNNIVRGYSQRINAAKNSKELNKILANVNKEQISQGSKNAVKSLITSKRTSPEIMAATAFGPSTNTNNNNFGGEAGKIKFGQPGYNRNARNKYLKTEVNRSREALKAFIEGKKNIRFNNFRSNIKFSNVPNGPLTQNNTELISNYNYLQNAQALNVNSKNFKHNEANIEALIPNNVTASDLATKFDNMGKNITIVAKVFQPFESIDTKWSAVAGALRGQVFTEKFKETNVEKINGVNAPHGGFFLRKMGNYGNQNTNNTKSIQTKLAELNAKLASAPNKMLSINTNEKGKHTVKRLDVIRYLFYVVRMMMKTILTKKHTNLKKAKIFVNATKKLNQKLKNLKAAEAGAKVSNAIGFNTLLVNLVTSVKNVVNSPDFKNLIPNNSGGYNLPISTEGTNNNGGGNEGGGGNRGPGN